MDEAMQAIMTRAAQDADYKLYMKRLQNAEKLLFDVEMSMTDYQRDTMWDFFGELEAVNRRLLEIACEQIKDTAH